MLSALLLISNNTAYRVYSLKTQHKEYILLTCKVFSVTFIANLVLKEKLTPDHHIGFGKFIFLFIKSIANNITVLTLNVRLIPRRYQHCTWTNTTRATESTDNYFTGCNSPSHIYISHRCGKSVTTRMELNLLSIVCTVLIVVLGWIVKYLSHVTDH